MRLTAQGYAEVFTARVEGAASFKTPVGSASGGGVAQGPRAGGSVIVSPSGVGGRIGASAGEVGGKVQITIGGQSYGAGGQIGLKAEIGLEWAPTSTIKLPLITITGPNPMAGVTSFAVNAVTALVRDPSRTIIGVVDVGRDAIAAVGQTLDSVADAVGDLFGADDDDCHIVISSQQQGPRPQNLPPGAVIFD
jgi:hypothetical protein